MSNADLLWNAVINAWPENSEYLTIGQIMELAPQGTGEIDIRASYDFAMLTMLSTARRSYVEHQNPAAQEAIDNEVVIANRNNGVWRDFLDSFVRQAP